MIYKRGKWYHMDDTVNGVRYREPLKTTNWQEALRLEKERLAEIAAGKGVNRHIAGKQTFNQAADSSGPVNGFPAAPPTWRSVCCAAFSNVTSSGPGSRTMWRCCLKSPSPPHPVSRR